MKKRFIEPVKDNISKQITYQELNKKCKQALKDNNYETVILLTYAMIEDRLLSFLHYMYIIDRNNNIYYPTKEIDTIIRPLLKYKEDSNIKQVYKIFNISTKLKILKLFTNNNSNIQYLLDCKNIIDINIGIDNYNKLLDDITTWIKYRNEIIHSSFNKDINDLNNKIISISKEGYRLSKLLSNYTNKIKTNNNQLSIRDKYINERIS